MGLYPVGEIIDNYKEATFPHKKIYRGEFVTLSPVSPESDLDDLYDASHGNDEKLAIWTYVPLSGPFIDKDKMSDWLVWCKDHKDFIFFAVRDNKNKKAIGMVSYVSIVPDMCTIELGFIWYSPEFQRSNINTESIFLMLCDVFDNLGYRRVEWKCDSLNAKSRAAAMRLGFSYEGIFKKHRIVNNRNRDTAWYSMTDDEWPVIKNNLKKWLYDNKNYESLTELNNAKERIRKKAV
jgi:RimJ/RimL family protein N-acetyltransferase